MKKLAISKWRFKSYVLCSRPKNFSSCTKSLRLASCISWLTVAAEADRGNPEKWRPGRADKITPQRHENASFR
ncbi:hypothetical protein BR93DRAFT_393520 [Coniochaeta sp. PMI_546]|nr:hypothetical protein BR93DRAFT_393520 [Coniochaeta sp. PMI_546]